MTQPTPFAPDASWRFQLRARVTTLWLVKMVANTLGVAVFFVAYFWVQNHPQTAVTVMPITAFDSWVSFEPAAMPLYLSLWLYISLPLALLSSRRELASYGLATLALSAIGLGIFFAYPTAVPLFGVDWAQHAWVAFLRAVDINRNACPSLHVAFAVFSAVWLERLLREMNVSASVRVLNGVWCIGILYSTLATRQHVVLDVLAGAVFGLSVVAVQMYALARLDRRAVQARLSGPERASSAA